MYLVFPASGQAAGRGVVQEATIPLSTGLFSAEKSPQSHFPAKSTVSIHPPVSLSRREKGRGFRLLLRDTALNVPAAIARKQTEPL